MSAEYTNDQVLGLTAQIVSAHVRHNSVPPDTLPALIQSVYHTLSKVGAVVQAPDKPQPAVPVKRSVFPDYIVCLEDGKKLKMLKRHLKTSFHMTPEQYRDRWGLPHDYPMVAPNYAQHRSSLAKKIGLGQKRQPSPPTPEPAPAARSTRRASKAPARSKRTREAASASD